MACECEICAELAGLPCRFHHIYGAASRHRIVASSPNFVVLPSLGQLGDAHLMVVSRRHETAVSRLEIALRQELHDLVVRVHVWLKTEVAPQILTFENGDPDGAGQMSCTVSHLHVHVVASRQVPANLHSKLQALGGEQVESFESVLSVQSAYSFVQTNPEAPMLIPNRLPSQTLRRLVARELGACNWDWRTAEREVQLQELVAFARVGLAGRHGAHNL
jgi:diadenosine tetraphosphate (Ap4A) HIT family hydrolase